MRDLLRKSSPVRSRRVHRVLGAAVAAAALLGAVPAVASAAPPARASPPRRAWCRCLAASASSGSRTAGTTCTARCWTPRTLAYNDMLAVWINNHATRTQQFRALQDSEYNNAASTAYDESLTISTALGSVLGRLYVKGTERGQLPLTQALINSSDGTAGAFVSTSTAKAYYSYPRPYLPTDPGTPPVPGDAAGCAPSLENGSSLTSIRVGQSYADAERQPEDRPRSWRHRHHARVLAEQRGAEPRLRNDGDLHGRVLPERAYHDRLRGGRDPGHLAARARAGDPGPGVGAGQRPHRPGRPLPDRHHGRAHRRRGRAGRPVVGHGSSAPRSSSPRGPSW